MLTPLLALSLSAQAATAKIVDASLFKNGYAVVTRQIDAPRAGEYRLFPIPQGSMGTLWFATSDGTRLESVTTTTVETTTQVPVANLDGILRANVGKVLVLGVKNGDSVTTGEVRGTLVSADGDIVVMKTATGTVAFSKALVTSVANGADAGGLLYSTAAKANQRMLRFETSGRPGKIMMVSLERGLTWAPGYAVDVTDPKKLTLTAKATVLNDLDPLEGIEVKLVTGFPHVPFAIYLDPLLSGQNVDAFLGTLSGVGGPGGGFGGGRGGGVMTQNAARPGAADFFEAMVPAGLPGEQRENLFFYRQPNVHLKKGDRGYYVLFRMESAFENVYTWDIDDATTDNLQYNMPPQGPADVWHTLNFKNTSGQPLTTAPATTFQGGEIIGQDLLSYVPNGAQAELRINKAIDIRAESQEAEVSRERGAIKNRHGDPIYDLVVLKGTLQILNGKSSPAKMRIRKTLTGEMVSAEGNPAINKTALGLSQVNPVSRVVWTPTVEAGKALKLEYSYKMYVRTMG